MAGSGFQVFQSLLLLLLLCFILLLVVDLS
jgi:hypothetical protein